MSIVCYSSPVSLSWCTKAVSRLRYSLLNQLEDAAEVMLCRRVEILLVATF